MHLKVKGATPKLADILADTNRKAESTKELCIEPVEKQTPHIVSPSSSIKLAQSSSEGMLNMLVTCLGDKVGMECSKMAKDIGKLCVSCGENDVQTPNHSTLQEHRRLLIATKAGKAYSGIHDKMCQNCFANGIIAKK